MPRIPRIVAHGLPHHVTQIGNNRQSIFHDKEEPVLYLEWFQQYTIKYGLTVLGYCLMDTGDLEQAGILFEKARWLARHQLPLNRRSFHWGDMEVRPYLRACFNLGLVSLRQGRIRDAILLWEESLRLCPDDRIGVRFILGSAYHRLGEIDEEALNELRAMRRGIDMKNDPGERGSLSHMYVRRARNLLPEPALQRVLERVSSSLFAGAGAQKQKGSRNNKGALNR